MWRVAGFACNNLATNMYMFSMMYLSYYLIGFVGVATVLASSFSTIYSVDLFHDIWVICALASAVLTVIAVISIAPKDRIEFFGTGIGGVTAGVALGASRYAAVNGALAALKMRKYMYKICKTEKSAERQRLFQTTLLAMMKKEHYQNITVTDLCREMSVPRKTFYRYYGTLEDVLHSILDDALTESFMNLEVNRDLVGFFGYWKQKKDLLQVLEKSGLSTLLVDRIYDRLNKEEDANMRLGSMDYLRYSGYVAAIMTILLSWNHAGMQQSVEEVSELVKHMFRMKNE